MSKDVVGAEGVGCTVDEGGGVGGGLVRVLAKARLVNGASILMCISISEQAAWTGIMSLQMMTAFFHASFPSSLCR